MILCGSMLNVLNIITIFITLGIVMDVSSNYIGLLRLTIKANKIKTNDDCVIYTYKDKKDADNMRAILAKAGIAFHDGQDKVTKQHLKDNNDYGILLTSNGIQQISSIAHEILNLKKELQTAEKFPTGDGCTVYNFINVD